MRILIISNLYPNPYQPQRATHNRQHFRALANDHQLKVVAPISWVDELHARRRMGNMLARDRCHQLDGMEVAHPRYYYPPGILRSFYGRCFLRSIRSCTLDIVRDFRPDCVLGSWAYPDGYAAVRLARALNLPVAVQVLGSDINLLDRFPSRRRQTWRTLHAADAVIPVSQDLAQKVIDQGIDPRRVTVVYRGIDKNVFCPGSQRDSQAELKIGDANPMLLFIGNLVPVKALDVLLTACALLVQRFPRIQLHIIGDGPLRKSLQAQAATLSIEERTHFHGIIKHGLLPTWYRAADLVILPSLAEGVPNVLLESIACGRPYVASHTGGIPEISHHAGCALVAPGNPRALAQAVAEKLQDAAAPKPVDLLVDSWDESGRMLGRALEKVAFETRDRANSPRKSTALESQVTAASQPSPTP